MNSRTNLEKYVIKNVEEQRSRSRERTMSNSTQVYIKDFPPDSVEIDKALEQLERQIPPWCFTNIDIIYIGMFDVFFERDVQAVYEDGAIYVLSEQFETEDFVESIGHEIAHAAEEIATEEVYGDSLLEKEFLGKRNRLRDILIAHGYQYTDGSFADVEYRDAFDHFLYKEVGYPIMTSLSSGLFMSPYAATSLREYFANGFEWFFLKNEYSTLKQISPILYNKLDKLSDI
jgi:hypothetical protein